METGHWPQGRIDRRQALVLWLALARAVPGKSLMRQWQDQSLFRLDVLPVPDRLLDLVYLLTAGGVRC
jgi:hypothetical protein